jgi:hypothetical protein
MEIVNVGRNHKNWARQFECEECGATVKVFRSDLYIDNDISTMRLVTKVYAICKSCSHPIIIDALPKRWDNLPNKVK